MFSLEINTTFGWHEVHHLRVNFTTFRVHVMPDVMSLHISCCISHIHCDHENVGQTIIQRCFNYEQPNFWVNNCQCWVKLWLIITQLLDKISPAVGKPYLPNNCVVHSWPDAKKLPNILTASCPFSKWGSFSWLENTAHLWLHQTVNDLIFWQFSDIDLMTIWNKCHHLWLQCILR